MFDLQVHTIGKEVPTTNMDRNEQHRQIDHIFNDLLPAAGMAKREAQITLSHNLLDAMLDRKITLCDAGTGIGKTFAYLAAGFVFQNERIHQHMTFQPLIITTSSIALQTELHNTYIPQLAQILTADGWHMDTSALSVVRKGKRHYVCDSQLEWRLRRSLRGHIESGNCPASETRLTWT